MTAAAAFPTLTDLLPHRPPMLWLDEVLDYGATTIACGLQVRASPAYGAQGHVEPVFAIEWMAQAVAAFIGLRDRGEGQAPRPGFLIGAPRVRFDVERFELGQLLRVEAEHTFGDAHLASFECCVRQDGVVMVDATLNFFRPRRGETWP